MPSLLLPFMRRLVRAVRRAVCVLASVAALLILFEAARATRFLAALHPVAMYALWLALLFAVFYSVIAYVIARVRRRTLYGPAAPSADAPFAALKKYVRHQIGVLKRASTLSHLEPETARALRQRAYDLQGLLGAHPLRDDLRRGIAKTESETWSPFVTRQSALLAELARQKMQLAVQDALAPPLPVVQPMFILYHQFSLVCAVVDLCVARPGLREYGIVCCDVLRTVARGDYFRIGHRLFEGVYANSPPLGDAVDDLGHALSVAWLTWIVAQAALDRCLALSRWTVEEAVQRLDRSIVDSLEITRDTLIRDILPVIKLRLRHRLGPGRSEASDFSEMLSEGIAKAVDSVVKSMRAEAPEEAVQKSRDSLHGTRPYDVGRPRRFSSVYEAPEWRPRRESEL